MNTTDNLTQEKAFARSACISDCQYNIKLELSKESNTYNGQCTVCFTLKHVPEQLEIDFISAEISAYQLNNSPTATAQQVNGLPLPKEFLQVGQNQLTVKYANIFNNNGQGLHKFTDPEDNCEYIYSDLEPFEAHRIFPCFDQPDIKATFQLTVTAPDSWQLISNSRPETSQTNGLLKTVHFAKTPPFSTYLFCIVAGDYYMFSDQSDFPIPMRIFCRASLKQYVRQELIFTITKQSMQFYQEFFQMPFPFDKYDHAFVPEFIQGAMENTGLITYTEQYLFRDTPTREMLTDFAGTIVHELAHMWFGNLTTMKWWGDLWLNESFATFLAYTALENTNPPFPDIKLRFCQEVKYRALFTDQLANTHPIMLNCPDTDTAFENFDSISYQKGAAVLFQLLKLMGLDNFRQAIHEYLKDRAWKNCDATDLIRCFSPYCNFDFAQWFELWFMTAGVNNVRAEIKTKQGKISHLKLIQGSDSGQTLRPHAACLALLYEQSNQKIELIKKDVSYAGKCTKISELNDLPEPDFIFCNQNDWDYVNCLLTDSSLKWLKKGLLCQIDDDLLRLQIWNSLIDMVNNQHLSPLSFYELALYYADLENNDDIFVHFMRYIPEFLYNFCPVAQRTKELPTLFAKALSQLENTGDKLDIDRQKLWFNYLIFAAQTKEELQQMVDFYQQKQVFAVKLDLEMNWKIVRLLATYRHESFIDILQLQQTTDQSYSGLNKACAAKALFSRDKKAIFQDIFAPSDLNLSRRAALMGAVFHPEQLHESQELVKPYFQKLVEISSQDDKIFRQYCINYLFPFYHTKAAIKQNKQLLNSAFPESLKKLLLGKQEIMLRRQCILKKYFSE